VEEEYTEEDEEENREEEDEEEKNGVDKGKEKLLSAFSSWGCFRLLLVLLGLLTRFMLVLLLVLLFVLLLLLLLLLLLVVEVFVVLFKELVLGNDVEGKKMDEERGVIGCGGGVGKSKRGGLFPYKFNS